MGAPDLLRDLHIAGFTLAVADGVGIRITPAGALTDDLRQAIRAHKPDLIVLLAGEAEHEAFEERAAIMQFDGGLPRADAEVAARACCDCEHFGRHRNCMEPVAAGLTTNHEIVWSEQGYAQTCAAFELETRP